MTTLHSTTPSSSSSTSSAPSSSKSPSTYLRTLSSLAKPTCLELDETEERESWSAEGSPESSYESDASDETSPSTSALSVPVAARTSEYFSKPRMNLSPSVSSALHPYPRNNTACRRPSRLSPLSNSSSINTPTTPLGSASLALPKSQPLSRALFARMSSDVPHAGSGSGSKKAAGGKGQKMIVPTKAFKTTFELGLTASELARKA